MRIHIAVWDKVALHPEGVDRNWAMNSKTYAKLVALHPEGVDRNIKGVFTGNWKQAVALHPEGVDRNSVISPDRFKNRGRPPPGGRG